MPLLRVDGGPTVPVGKTLVAATLTVVLLSAYADGSARYPERWEAEWDATNNRWKPRGTTDGTLFYVPGGASGQPEPPLSRCHERHAYSDGTVGGPPAWEQRIYQTSSNVWAYRAAPPGALVIADPSLPANALAAAMLGVANGVAPLGADGKVPIVHLPSSTIPSLPMAVVRRESAQIIPSGSFVPVQFTSEPRNTHGFVDLGTHNTRITIPANMGGWYWFQAEADFAASNGGQRQWTFRKNGATYRQSAMIPATLTIRHSIPISTVLYLDASDYVEFCVYQDAGLSLNIGDGGSLYPQMSAIKVG